MYKNISSCSDLHLFVSIGSSHTRIYFDADLRYRAVVTDINSSLAAVLKDCGPAILINQDIVKQMTAILLDILDKRHPCQQDLGEEDETESLEESSEWDWQTIDAALDLVAGLATALGPLFGELWKIFEKPVMKYASSSEATERAAGVGTIATCIGGMGGAVGPFTPVCRFYISPLLLQPHVMVMLPSVRSSC